MAIRREDSRHGSLGVTTVTIDHPSRNILDLEHCRALSAELEGIRREGKSRVVVLRGAGAQFSTGVDIRQHTPDLMPTLLPAFHDVFDALLALDAITVAAVHGWCLGGGAELALACDRVLAREDARFGFPEINVGCFPPVAVPLLAARVGVGQALPLILEGKDRAARELLASGMVSSTTAGDLSELVEREIARYCDKSSTVVGMVARVLHVEARRAWGCRIREVEKVYLEQLLQHPDASEGVAAFLEKRPPVWRGE